MEKENGKLAATYGVELARLDEIKKRKKDIKSENTSLTQEQEKIEEALSQKWDDEELTRVTWAGKTFFRRSDVYVSVGNMGELKASLEAIGRSDLVVEHVNSQRLRSLCNELSGNNQPLPEGIVTFTRNRIGIRE